MDVQNLSLNTMKILNVLKNELPNDKLMKL